MKSINKPYSLRNKLRAEGELIITIHWGAYSLRGLERARDAPVTRQPLI